MTAGTSFSSHCGLALPGKVLNLAVRSSQVIALRFASAISGQSSLDEVTTMVTEKITAQIRIYEIWRKSGFGLTSAQPVEQAVDYLAAKVEGNLSRLLNGSKGRSWRSSH